MYKENYSNNLYYKQEEIDKFLKSFSDQLYYIEKEKNLKSKKNTDKNINIANILVTTIKLRNLRLLLQLYKSEKMEDCYAVEDGAAVHFKGTKLHKNSKDGFRVKVRKDFL